MIPIPPKYIKYLLAAAVVVIIAVAAAIWVKCSRTGGPVAEVRLEIPTKIAVTPQVVESVRNIRQWEFVKVTCEEVADTVRPVALWPDDALVLIFHGSPRIGIDMADAPADWVVNRNDSLTVTLPQPRLLDDRFIDEALTEVFYQRGRWSAADREHMYAAAARRMRATALTASNLDRARRAAAERFTGIFMSAGARHVDVRFAN